MNAQIFPNANKQRHTCCYHLLQILHMIISMGPDSKVQGANVGPTWVLSAPDGPHVGPLNLAIRGPLHITASTGPDVSGICGDFSKMTETTKFPISQEAPMNLICTFRISAISPGAQWVNSSPPSAAYMRQRIGSALVQIMACCIFGAKPLSKPMQGYCQLDP